MHLASRLFCRHQVLATHSGCAQPVMPQSPPPMLEVPLWFIWLLLMRDHVPRSAADQLLPAIARLLPQQPEHLDSAEAGCGCIGRAFAGANTALTCEIEGGRRGGRR